MATVYALTCYRNGMAYIGCTAGKIGKRMREHRCLLNAGKHAEAKLQRDWTSFGPSAFAMIVLETLPPDASVALKREAELRWMHHYENEGRLYNRNKSSFSGTPEAIKAWNAAGRNTIGDRWSSEANLKRSLTQLGKPKGHGAKISATKRAKRQQEMR